MDDEISFEINVMHRRLPCPLCGGDGIVVPIPDGEQTLYYVHCDCCGFNGPTCSSGHEAVGQWYMSRMPRRRQAAAAVRPTVTDRQGSHLESQTTDMPPIPVRSRGIRLESNTVKTFFSFAIIIALITLPTFILSERPQFYNPLTQVLFDLLLFAASLWFAFTISNKEAKKNATDKWLPAAETACNELLTMSTTTERMRLSQAKSCESLQLVFPDIPAEKLAPVKQFFESHCGQCRGNLTDLKNHVENSFRNWEVFITKNCEQAECQTIRSRLRERRNELDAAIQKEFLESS